MPPRENAVSGTIPTRHQRVQRNWTPVIAFLVLFLVALFMWGPGLIGEARLYTAQYSDDLYAFYLDSGNVFFGEVRGYTFGHITLVNAYTFQEVSVGDTSTNNFIAQRNNPLTRPDNWMVLERSRVLFFEKIGRDASVLKLISSRP